MMENEAIKELSKRIELIEKDYKEEAREYKEVLETAVKALSEIQQYRAIGTVGECREAIEMQKKKKPNLVTPCKSVNYYQCPVCRELVSMNENFCNNCGQALYWEE